MTEPDKDEASTLSDEEAAKALADCLLSQFPFFLGGAGLGTAYAVRSRTKNYMPLLVGGMVGSVADLVYGYTVKCVTQVEASKHAQGRKS